MKAELNALFADMPELKLVWPAFFVTGDVARFKWAISAMRANDASGTTDTAKSLPHPGDSVVEMRGDRIMRHANYLYDWHARKDSGKSEAK